MSSKIKTPLKASVVEDAAFTEVPQSDATFGASFADIFAGFEIPSGKRVIVSLIAGLVVAACTAYVGISLVAYLTVGAMLLSGSAFLTFIVSFLGYVLTLLLSLYSFGKVQAFILTGGVDRCYQNASSFVGGLFGSKKEMSHA